MSAPKTTDNFTLRLPQPLRARLEAAARTENRSLGNYIATILIRAAEGAPPAPSAELVAAEERAAYQVGGHALPRASGSDAARPLGRL